VEEVLRQAVNLIIASLPTTVIVFLFFLFARSVFFKPMLRVLDERAARTQGARDDAARLNRQAQEVLSRYHQALDKVRAEIYAAQEAARHEALNARAEVLRQARAAAADRVRQAKERYERDLAGVRGQLDREIERLADAAARAVLAEKAPALEQAGES
jgi:F-type H+-transporting ATPase subunit b